MSKIGNRSLMRSLGRVLGIEDVLQAPSKLRTDELIATVGLEPGLAGMEQFQLSGTAPSLDGATNATWVIAGEQSLSHPGFDASNVYAANGEREMVILGMRLQVVYVNPALDNPAQMGLVWYRQAANSIISAAPESTINKWVVTDGTKNIYTWSHPYHQDNYVQSGDPTTWIEGGPILAMPPIYVPAGSVYAVQVLKISGGAATWPAGTTLRCNAFGITVPKGMRPPLT